MVFNETLVEDLINNSNSKFSLVIENKILPLANVVISKSSTPLKKPNTRGGVYFSGTHSYRIKATTDDLSIIPLISKTMLGPNTEFSEITITTKLTKNGNVIPISLYTNLTNSMESKSRLQLDMVIVRTSSDE